MCLHMNLMREYDFYNLTHKMCRNFYIIDMREIHLCTQSHSIFCLLHMIDSVVFAICYDFSFSLFHGSIFYQKLCRFVLIEWEIDWLFCHCIRVCDDSKGHIEKSLWNLLSFFQNSINLKAFSGYSKNFPIRIETSIKIKLIA